MSHMGSRPAAGRHDVRRLVAAAAAVLVALITAGACSAGISPPASLGPLEPEAAGPSTTSALEVPPTTGSTSTTAPGTTIAAGGGTTTTSSPPAPGLSVRSVTDGDTLVVTDGRRVRLAQVDAPETSDCFGSQATEALRRMAQGQAVTLRRPSNGPERDRYGRTLAEVLVAGRSVNEALVAEGAAEWYEAFAREDPDLARRLRAAEEAAREAGRGLWSACRAGAAAPPASPAPAAGTGAGGSTTSGGCHPAYPDDCIPPAPPDLDCGDISRRVRVDHGHGDPHRFDADTDGWGCESYG